MRARFVVLANGILTTPRLARIKGMESFAGESFHTSRWNYHVDLAGKRVDEINKMAELGTQLAHVDGGVPNIRITIPELKEYWLDIGRLSDYEQAQKDFSNLF